MMDHSQRLRRLRTICGALALSVVLMNVVITFLWLSGSLPPKILPESEILGTFAAALLMLVAAPSVKRTILKRTEAEFEGDRDRWLIAWSTGTLLAFALREGAGLIGFVLALLNGNAWWSWATGAAALLAMFVDRPQG
ncbi:MAG TPA: hypothetical protein VLX28_16525 [Thermoanaerobaculia bacterium]|nr:hypothetical protein [Thermoanaerobaculia bacterium]